jgi:hypothetical protein
MKFHSRWKTALFVVLLLVAGSVYASVPVFPRLMGMNIGKKNYDDPAYIRDLARLNIVVLGFYRGWNPKNRHEPIRTAVSDLKRLNPNILVGQYTVLNETYDDPANTATADVREKIYESDWWLRNARGSKVQWTRIYGAWEVNMTGWARPDSQGRRYPEWLAAREYNLFFQDPSVFDIWYVDNVMTRPRVRADWDLDGIDDKADDPRILAAHRNAYRELWRNIRNARPDVLIVGNADGDLSEREFRGELSGAFLEGLIGKSWSIESRQGWDAMMRRYRTTRQNLREPRIVGFNVWGDLNDYRTFRYAFASCLMDDGYFSYTDETTGYSSVPWFDEYDLRLGQAVTAPPTRAWQRGVWRRDFERGVVLVNPTNSIVEVLLERQFRRLSGNQDPRVNSGEFVRKLVLPPRDGILLER